MVRNSEMGIYASQSHCQLTSLTKQCPEQVQHEKRQPQKQVAQPHKRFTIMSNCYAKVKDFSIKGSKFAWTRSGAASRRSPPCGSLFIHSQLAKRCGKNCRW